MKKYVVDPLKSILAPTGEVSLTKDDTALLIIDMQYLDAHPDYGLVLTAKKEGIDTSYYEERLKLIIKNIEELLHMSREKGVEVIHVTIESLTRSGRDRNDIHKWTDLHAPPGSKLAAIIEELEPIEEEMVFKKTCSGVFNGTNIDQVLRNIGIKNLIVVGVVTNQCVSTAVRGAADRGYFVTLVEDACAAFSESLHQASVEILGGEYCYVNSTSEVLNKINKEN